MANHLPREKKETAIRCLLDGSSIRATERILGVHRDTIMRLSVRVGNACHEISDRLMRNLSCERIQVDEIWCYVGKKQRHVTPDDDRNQVGDTWTWVALDADTKVVPAYRVSKRDGASANAFIADLASRVMGRIQLSSDALAAYEDAVERAFGPDVDYGQIVKRYEAEPIGPGRYSPPKVISTEKRIVTGKPDEKHISTSYIERQNLTMRMCMRRFTRLTNAFSKKLENLKAAVGLHFAYYNFVRPHKALEGITPAMAAGVADKMWEVSDLLEFAGEI